MVGILGSINQREGNDVVAGLELHREEIFEDRFSGLNSLGVSDASEADLGFTRPGRYLKQFLPAETIFR